MITMYGMVKARSAMAFDLSLSSTSGISRLFLRRYFSAISLESVVLIAKNSTPLSRSPMATWATTGNPRRQGGHHVAQKSRTTTLPFNDDRGRFVPLARWRTMLGAGGCSRLLEAPALLSLALPG